MIQNKAKQGFPGGAVVKNLPANAGDAASIPGPGRSHIAVEQLSSRATTTEPVVWGPGTVTAEPKPHNLLKPTCSRACAAQPERPPQGEGFTPHREKPAQQRGPSTAKTK